MGLKAKCPSRFKKATDSNHKGKTNENLVRQNFAVEKTEQIWLSDITYKKKLHSGTGITFWGYSKI